MTKTWHVVTSTDKVLGMEDLVAATWRVEGAILRFVDAGEHDVKIYSLANVVSWWSDPE